jgi:hypothetical protein
MQNIKEDLIAAGFRGTIVFRSKWFGSMEHYRGASKPNTVAVVGPISHRGRYFFLFGITSGAQKEVYRSLCNPVFFFFSSTSSCSSSRTTVHYVPWLAIQDSSIPDGRWQLHALVFIPIIFKPS